MRTKEKRGNPQGRRSRTTTIATTLDLGSGNVFI